MPPSPTQCCLTQWRLQWRLTSSDPKPSCARTPPPPAHAHFCAHPPSAHAHYLPAEGGRSAHVRVRVNRSTLLTSEPVNGAAGGKVECLVRRAFGAMCSDFHRSESGTEVRVVWVGARGKVDWEDWRMRKAESRGGRECGSVPRMLWA